MNWGLQLTNLPLALEERLAQLTQPPGSVQTQRGLFPLDSVAPPKFQGPV